MKAIILLLTLIFSLVAHSRENVLLVFPKLENLSLTGNLVMLGIDISSKQYGSLNQEFNFIKIEPDRNLKELASILEESIKKYKPVAIIGAITSNSALVIGDIAQANKIPFITPFATHPDVTKDRNFVFRACFEDDYQAQKLAEFAVNDLKKKRIAILYNQTSSYALGIRKRFTEMLSKLGVTPVLEKSFFNATDLDEKSLQAIKESKPDLILVPSYQVEAAAVIAKLIKTLPKTTVYLGSDSWGGGRLFHSVFNQADPKFKGFYVQHISAQNLKKATADFEKGIREAKLDGYDPKKSIVSMIAPVAIGYDSGKIFFEAYQKSIKQKIPLNKAIEQVSFNGITGTIQFSEGNTPKKPLYIYSINNTSEQFYKEFK